MMHCAPSARLAVVHASRDALAPRTADMLGRLGYELISPEVYEEACEKDPERRPDFLLIDERRLGEVERYEGDGHPVPPIVLLCGPSGATGADARIVGAVKRPAGLHDLYRLVQQVFEETPRSTPRVATQLRARLARGEQAWEGRILSLSENGCLVRAAESVPLGQAVQLDFMLPKVGPLSLRAEATYQLLPDTGLVFSQVSASARDSLIRFVTQSLLAE